MEKKSLVSDVMKRAAYELFPFKQETPESYGEREGCNWLAFSFADYSYDDPELEQWIEEVLALLKGESRLVLSPLTKTAKCPHRP